MPCPRFRFVVADAARLSRPDLHIIFMTGYAENAALASGFLKPGMEMITKPFTMGVLAKRVRFALEGGSPDSDRAFTEPQPPPS